MMSPETRTAWQLQAQKSSFPDTRILNEAEFLRPHSAHGVTKDAEETERDNTKTRAERRTDRITGCTGWG